MGVGIEDILNAGSKWVNTSTPAGTGIDDFAVSLLGVGQVLIAIGVVTLLIVSAIMAIKWITSSPDKKADLKQQLIGLVVAAVVIFGALGIWRLGRSIGNKIEKNLGDATPKTQTIYFASIEK